MNYALVNTSNNTVENVIVLEDSAAWSPPDGFIVVPLIDNFTIGDTWDGSQFGKNQFILPESISEGVQNVIG